MDTDDINERHLDERQRYDDGLRIGDEWKVLHSIRAMGQKRDNKLGHGDQRTERQLLVGLKGEHKMTYSIGQVFTKTYPPEAAQWCNANNAYINEIENQNGVRRFQIVAVPDPTDDEVAAQVRGERDAKIAATDYLAMPDYPLSDGERVQVFAYRQALRDVPTQEDFLREVVWPSEPKILKVMD